MLRIQYAVFDLDGTIVDSEWAHEEAKRSIMADLGGQCDIDLNYFVGRSNRDFWKTVLAKMGKEGDIEALVRLQFERVLSALRRENQSESPGLTRLLRYCRDTGRKTAVCSGSDEHFVLDVLDFLGVRSLFDVVITSKDVTRLKPAPDIFLAALDRAKIPGTCALAFEDSHSGCLSAHAAGMRCIGYTAGGRNPQNLDEANFLVSQLDDAISIMDNLEARERG